MIITCEKCDIRFNLNESLLKPSGSKVRCSKCKHVFTAYPPMPEKEPEETKEDVPDLESDDDLDFSGLEQMLESDDSSKDEKPSGKDRFEAETVEEDDDVEEEIDISGLEHMLESDEESELSDDLDFSFDPDETDAAEEVAAADDELEDIELDLSPESDEADEAEEVSAVDDELEDIELDLSPESDETDEAEAVSAADDELEDLELELDDEDSEKTIESDLLSTRTVSAVEKDSDDLDIELDIDEESEESEEPPETSEELIDLAELEQTLEMELLSPGGDDESEEEPENVDLELADDEDMIDGDEEGKIFEPANDADVSDIEQMLDMDSDTGADAASDEIELEFDINGKPDVDQAGLEPDSTFVVNEEKESVVSEDQLAEEGAVKAKAKPKPKEVSKIKSVKEKKISTPVVVLIVIALLIGAAVGGYFLLESQGVKIPSIKELNIPYISDLFTSGSKKDLGTVEAVQSNVRSEFADNAVLGRLFVISGEVKNSTSKTHHSVKVTAKLYASGKKLAKSKTVYAGNKLSKEELASSDLVAMNHHQANRFSSSGQLIRIKPGETIPFMIVIPNLPEDLEEYKVMVSESIPE
ncbi:MAG: zinc-ribbon domain-containing protein [Desulfobacterales bacterium]